MNSVTSMLSFVQVVETGSFTAAAKKLGLSQPVISRQIRQLEDHLGVRLLNRSTRRLHLTEAGQLFFRRCLEVDEAVHAAEAAVMPLQREPQGQLRITAPQCLSNSLLRNSIQAFQQRYPLVEIDLMITGKTVDLIDANIDLALRLGELRDSSLIARKLSTATFIVCASPDYWQEHGKPEHPRELAQHNCLIYSDKPNRNQWLFQDRNKDAPYPVSVSGSLQSDDASLILELVKAGRGVMYAPSFLFQRDLQNGLLETALEPFYAPPLGLYLVYPHAENLAPKTRAFLDYLFSDEAAGFVRELSFTI